MALSTQGILAAVTIVMYIPFLFTSFKVARKYGIWRGGWTSLLVFCIARVSAGSFLVAAEFVKPANTGLYTAGYILEVIALSPLLLCTSSLLRTISEEPDDKPDNTDNTIFLFLQLSNTAGVLLTVIGISNATRSSASASTMRKAGFLIFSVLYVALVGIWIFLWTKVRLVMKYRKRLLKAVSIALPFLAIRTVYGVLSTISTSTFTFSTNSSEPSTSDLAEFNLVTGEWQIYLVMVMLAEYAIVIIYTVAALVLPLNDDYKPPGLNEDEFPLNRT
ncbi:hypothetical protein DEU56DRAFT_741214 [Suillus clintonianus]|uniref:uncharacterized protein n=1 Tax=Suillus clintonianus TaxID=1904413 RepID=UPI001B85DB2F|nr:uncharacterized protein DEU56DRAFT_741214 [Suillus clintonianus]KAG2129744.1 hypothetical protein DEU56DRAFT_741214 [Suillus clintonianus]